MAVGHPLGENLGSIPCAGVTLTLPERGKIGETFAKVIAFIVGIFGIVVGATVYGLLAGGFILHKLWIWFMVPIFGIRPLSIREAIAVLFVTGFVIHPGYKNTEYIDENGVVT